MASAQYVLVLVGLPGSGKSSLSQLFERQGWCYINQDTLGSRQACERKLESALLNGFNCVIDRCNIDIEQRRPWITIVHMLRQSGRNIRLLACVLETPINTCIIRAQQRTEHATLSPEEVVPVIERFERMYQSPRSNEGFTRIYRVYPDEDGDKVVDRITSDIDKMNSKQEKEPSSHRQFSSWSTTRSDRDNWRTKSSSIPPPPPPPSSSSRRDRTYASNAVPAGNNFSTSTSTSGRGSHNTTTDASSRQHQTKKPAYNYHPNTRTSLKPDYKDILLIDNCDNRNNGKSSVIDTRAILLFDLNGTLTSHTSMRRSVGKHQPRPGTHLLKQLTDDYQLGVFTSATLKTTDYAVNMLETKARISSSGTASEQQQEEEDTTTTGRVLFKNPRLVLHRDHTMPAPLSRIKSAQGKPWDTVKPLYLHFSKLHRVLLFDDDDHKVHDGERDNVVLIPTWEKDDPNDRVLEAVVECVKNVLGGLGEDADLRLYRCALEDAIREAVLAQEVGEKVTLG